MLEEDPDDKSGMISAQKSRDGLFVASLAKGFRVLECFDGGQAELQFAEIVKRSKIGQSAAQRAIATLFALNYLTRDDSRRTYRLSHKFLTLTRSFSFGSGLVKASMPELMRLHELTDETVNVTERDDTDIVFVARVPGRHTVTISIDVGARLPVFATAPGLVTLSYESNDIARDVIMRSKRTKFTDKTVTKFQDLQDILFQIRNDGYYLSDQLRFEGEYSVAAPIFGLDNVVVGAVNASVPVARWSEENIRKDLAPLVIETGKRISANILNL